MKRIRSGSFAVLALIGAIVALAGAWPAAGSGGDGRRTVVVGVYENAPKIHTAADGRPAGLFVELLDEMARLEGWRLRYEPCPWSRCLEWLVEGRIDLMPDVAFSGERAQLYDFHGVSVTSGWSQVYARPGLGVSSLTDLVGRRVAVLAGGIQQGFFAQLMSGAGLPYTPVEVGSLEDGYAAVAAGTADAVVSNNFFAAYNGARYALQETPIVFLPSTLYYASGKGRNADLLAAIDKHLAAWRRDADSVYFAALRRAMAAPPEVLVPHWVRWLLAALGGALALLAGVSLLLRWQVAQRTRELEVERANLEREVAARTGELQAVFDSASAAIVLLRKRTVVRANRRLAEMLSYADDELVGRSTRLWYPDDETSERIGAEAYGRLATGDIYRGEVELCRKDGSRFWCRLSIRAIDSADLARGVVAIVEDITAERAAREEILRAKALAEEAAGMKSEFLANMSHEIRTPMNAILGMLYLAQRGDLPPVARSRLAKAQGAAHSLLGIIDDILDFSKIEAGKLDIEAVEFSLEHVLEQLIDALGCSAGQKGLELLVRYDPAIPPRLIGDPLRLGQVLLNLCGNAIKFTAEGEVEVALRGIESDAGGLTLQVCIRDSGIGMSQEAQARLFEKFTQADQSTTRRFGGTGLGLAISKNLVELMGGQIRVEASVPGKGTTICFTVRLGVARSAPRGELLEQVGPLLQGVRVLVVDDNEASREILSEMLRFFRVDVEVAASGAAALDLMAGGHRFDLVLMDWWMPGMNGDEVASRIVAGSGARPKVVMVTAHGREEVVRLAEQAGIDGFLVKPVSPSTLLDTVLSVLGRGRILGDGSAAPARPAGAGGGRLSGARVLLVEDNDINREFATELLRGEGVTVDEAENGAVAVDMVRRQAYDAVLMDIQMPVMDGLEAARAIRALASTPGGERCAALPIIAMTALAMAEDAEKSRAAGMNDHVTKPIDPERLLSALAAWVGERPAAAAAGSPPESALPESALPPELAALRCVDAREGVYRIGGRAEAYRRQLARFRERYAGAVDELRRLLAERRTAEAAACHALKGVCGNLAARALHETLAAIDLDLRAGQEPDPAAVDRAGDLLAALVDEITGIGARAVPEAPAGGERIVGGELRSCLSRLAQALQYDLGTADTLLAELRAGVDGTPFAGRVADIAALVDVFDIDAALGKLKQLEDEMS